MSRPVMMLVLFSALNSFLVAGINAQNAAMFFQRDHAFGLSALQLRYEYLLSETVFAGFPGTASLAYYEIPSSAPERGVWMHADEDDYIVVFARSKSNLWQWAEFGSVGETKHLDVASTIKAVQEANLVEFQERKLSTSIGKRTEAAWHRAVFGIKGSEKQSGLDGSSFVFRAYSKENGRASWDAWSPPPDSLADRLSALAVALGRFCEDGSMQDLEAALNDLEKSNSR